jgi:hypothetical protein
VYGEERLQTGTGPTSLTHAYGVDFAPSRQWTYGLKVERGKISDPLAGDLSLAGVAATRIGDKLKIGAGYNFTDYSDNLTDVSYRSRGFFINTIAKF